MAMGLHLTKTEEWVLRYAFYLRETTPKPQLTSFVRGQVPSADPIGKTGKPATYDDLEKAAGILGMHGLLEVRSNSSALIVTLTGLGIEHLRKLDNPDYIEKWTTWVHGHPLAAALAIVLTISGSLAGWASLLWNIFGPQKK
jgi:hypothetical protein